MASTGRISSLDTQTSKLLEHEVIGLGSLFLLVSHIAKCYHSHLHPLRSELRLSFVRPDLENIWLFEETMLQSI